MRMVSYVNGQLCEGMKHLWPLSCYWQYHTVSKIDDHFNWYLCMYSLYERCDILLACCVYQLCVGCKIILCSARHRYGYVCIVHNITIIYNWSVSLSVMGWICVVGIKTISIPTKSSTISLIGLDSSLFLTSFISFISPYFNRPIRYVFKASPS